MRFLFNATSTVKGGGAQRSASFIRELIRDPRGHEWCIAHSPGQADVIREVAAPVRTVLFEDRPSRSRQARGELHDLERDYQPDAVYTLGGPAYVRFAAPHLMGVADGWVTHSTWTAYRTLPFPVEWAKMLGASLYKVPWLRCADAWIIQTSSARRCLHWRLRIPLRKIAVVPNTCASIYLDEAARSHADLSMAGPLRILCFAAAYFHKRLDMIPFVARELRRIAPGLEFRFLVTLPEDAVIWQMMRQDAIRLEVSDCIENRGPVAHRDGPSLYRDCHLCFLPTVLETFSASYPEAMAMSRPIVTTDLDFARDVCGDAALYFRPNDVQDAAAQILCALTDDRRRAELVGAGMDKLRQLPTAPRQYHRQVDLLEALAERRFEYCASQSTTHT